MEILRWDKFLYIPNTLQAEISKIKFISFSNNWLKYWNSILKINPLISWTNLGANIRIKCKQFYRRNFNLIF